jgi:hypothetical protein
MYLREKDGKYAGEIRDFPPDVARQLLASGRAENPYLDPAPEIKLPVSTPKAAKKVAR